MTSAPPPVCLRHTCMTTGADPRCRGPRESAPACPKGGISPATTDRHGGVAAFKSRACEAHAQGSLGVAALGAAVWLLLDPPQPTRWHVAVGLPCLQVGALL